MSTQVRTFARGVRLVQHGCVLSEILRDPGPTHSVFDLLAAAAVTLGRGPRLAMLGFAGGGMMAPLRALGGRHRVVAVDLDASGYGIYREVVGDRGGALRFVEGDAVAWLRRQAVPFDVIVEDLSVPVGRDVVKPEVSWEVLPGLMHARRSAGGVVVSNLLPSPGLSMAELVRRCRVPGPGCLVELHQFHNRVLIQGAEVGPAREVGRYLRERLRELGSRLADSISVHRLPDGKSLRAGRS